LDRERPPTARWRVGARVAVAFGVALGTVCVAALALERRWKPDGSTGRDADVARWFAEHRSNARTDVMHVVTWFGSARVVVPIALCVVVALMMCRRTWLAAFVALAVAGLGVLVLAGKNVSAHERSPVGPFGSSFPSGHAAQSATICLALVVAVAVLTRSRALRVGAVTSALLVVVVVGVSRVYLEVHWASDVLGGWLLAATWVGGLTIALRHFIRRSPARSPTSPMPAEDATAAQAHS
jgi:membrane-associated phospholipid phosphatase